jgi:hypothetical protein
VSTHWVVWLDRPQEYGLVEHFLWNSGGTVERVVTWGLLLMLAMTNLAIPRRPI